MQETNKENVSIQAEKSDKKHCYLCGMSGEHRKAYNIVRWVLAVFILVFVFCFGVRVGNFNHSSFRSRSDRYFRNMGGYYGSMMDRGGQWNMMQNYSRFQGNNY